MSLTISKSKFKPQALRYFRKVQENGEEIIITDHNHPVVKISPYKDKPSDVLKELRGSVKRYDEPLEPVAINDWELLK